MKRFFLLISFFALYRGGKELKIFRFGDENQLGTGSDEDINAEDYLLIQPEKAIGNPLPKQFSLCFNMFYTALDYWNKNQKTILRINGENDTSSSTSFFMKINNSPPRGTMILVTGPEYESKWSGGLGDYRYEDLAFRRWSSICISLDLEDGHIVNFIDGRKVADEALNEDFQKGLHSGPWPQKVQMFKVGENMVGLITNLHMKENLLSEDEMEKITTCKLKLDGDIINWETDSINVVGTFIKQSLEKMKYKELCKPTELRNELFSGRKNVDGAVKFCQQLRSTMPVIRNKDQYLKFGEYVQQLWRKYPNVSSKCKGFVHLPQTRTDLGPYIDPFTNTPVEFLQWAELQPSRDCKLSSDTFDGLRVNLNTTDQSPDGYYCINSKGSWSGHKACYVCEHSNPLPLLFTIRGLCGKSQFNQKYVLVRDSLGYQFYQGDSHANITYDWALETWVMNSMVNKKYRRIQDKYTPSLTRAFTNITHLKSKYQSYFLGKHSLTFESDPRCGQSSVANHTILFSNCEEHEFTCEDGYCLSMDFRCNGVINCPSDNTDEANCSIVVMDNTYQKDYAPVKFVKNDMLKVNVSTSIDIESILLISEKDSLIILKLSLKILWFDHRLQFNNLKNITSMNTFPVREKEQLWIPDVVFSNTETREGIEMDRKAFLTVRKLGKYKPEDIQILANRLVFKGSENPIIYTRPFRVQLTCTFNVAWYPFDFQHCMVELATEGNSGLYVQLLADSVRYRGPTELSQYFIKRTKIQHDSKKVWAEIVLGRRLLSAIMTVFVPTLLINVISYATNFFKPFYFEAAVTVNLTAMLVITMMFISTSDSLPTTNYIKMVEVWLLFNLFLPFLIVLLLTYMESLRDDEEREVNHHGHAVEVESNDGKHKEEIFDDRESKDERDKRSASWFKSTRDMQRIMRQKKLRQCEIVGLYIIPAAAMAFMVGYWLIGIFTYLQE